MADWALQQPNVIDNGTGVIKAGLAGEDKPSLFVHNLVGRPKHLRVMPGGALEGSSVCVALAGGQHYFFGSTPSCPLPHSFSQQACPILLTLTPPSTVLWGARWQSTAARCCCRTPWSTATCATLARWS